MTVHNNKTPYVETEEFQKLSEARRKTLRSADKTKTQEVGKRLLPAFLTTKAKGKKVKAKEIKAPKKAKKTDHKDGKAEKTKDAKAKVENAKIGNARLALLDLAAASKVADDSSTPPTPKIESVEADFAEDEVKKPELILPHCASWKPRQLSYRKTVEKMFKNSVKTMQEHIKKEEKLKADAPSSFLSVEKAIPKRETFLKPKKAAPLQLTVKSAASQGKRPTMEDAHFSIEIPRGTLAGVFDGHGGEAVAKFSSEQFQKRFPEILEKTKGNVHQAFEQTIDEIHHDVLKNADWNRTGSTAVVTFIDKETNFIYTATLGDSEANIYRNVDGALYSIPLSCIRDWSSEKDALRAAISLDRPEIAAEWPQSKEPKKLRYEVVAFIKEGKAYYHTRLNVARAIGDKTTRPIGTTDKPGVIHKPKITINKLEEGDIVILACDGLKDIVKEAEIVNLIYRKEHGSGFFGAVADAYRKCTKKSVDLSQALVDASVSRQTPLLHDNVTVVALRATKASSGNGSGSGSSSRQVAPAA